jgi:hypothetical protein
MATLPPIEYTIRTEIRKALIVVSSHFDLISRMVPSDALRAKVGTPAQPELG